MQIQIFLTCFQLNKLFIFIFIDRKTIEFRKKDSAIRMQRLEEQWKIQREENWEESDQTNACTIL